MDMTLTSRVVARLEEDGHSEAIMTLHDGVRVPDMTMPVARRALWKVKEADMAASMKRMQDAAGRFYREKYRPMDNGECNV